MKKSLPLPPIKPRVFQCLNYSKKLASLESITAGAGHTHIAEVRDAGLLLEVDIGVWELRGPQPFTIRVVYPKLCELWNFFKDPPSDMSRWTEPNPFLAAQCQPNAALRVCMKVYGLVLDAARGVGRLMPGLWYAWFMRPSKMQQVNSKLIAGAELEGPRRLKDVDATCSQEILKWAKDVLIEAMEVLGGPSLIAGGSTVRLGLLMLIMHACDMHVYSNGQMICSWKQTIYSQASRRSCEE
ncbi:hypothetical protein LTR17_017904 [Elasticomyces elasticus]|nr:hypothetical protein LTR17_017904 [Elasticomyces elasticus]